MLPIDKLARGLARGAGLLSERERGALVWAETVTQVGQTVVTDEKFMAASEVFSQGNLVDLTVAIGLMNTYNRLAIGFRKAPEVTRRGEG